jgi:hypothetical protein
MERVSNHTKWSVALIATSTVILGHSTATLALPLLSESAALNTGSALTLYPDHQDPQKFYFMPNSATIGRDNRGVPTFSLTHWGLSDPNSSDAGGLLVYVGRLTSDPEQAKALAQFLAARPGAGVAVLPVKESIVGLDTTLGAGATPLPSLFSEFNFARKAGRAEDEVGINAVLTRTGARALKASILKEAGANLKWDLCYKVEGLGPAMDGRIQISMSRVYEHFAAQASVGKWFWRATIRTEIEKLIKSNHISWEINGGDAKDEDYIREVVNQVVTRLFTPELSMSPSAQQSPWSRWTPFSFGGSYTYKKEEAAETWTIKRRVLVEREFCSALAIKDLAPFKDNVVIDAD